MTPDDHALMVKMDAEDTARRARLQDPAALLAGALFYAKAGMPVFPLRPGGKVPLLRNAHPDGDPARGTCKGECGRHGHGLYDASTNVDLIRSWWSATPTANIGLPTGGQWDVIDVDISDDGPNGYLALDTLRGQGLIPPVHGRVITPSGGTHLYIEPTGDGNSAGLMPGIDYRGLGGYVVAPPSRTADGMWAWSTPLEMTA